MWHNWSKCNEVEYKPEENIDIKHKETQGWEMQKEGGISDRVRRWESHIIWVPERQQNTEYLRSNIWRVNNCEYSKPGEKVKSPCKWKPRFKFSSNLITSQQNC